MPSTVIRSFSYDPDKRELQVVFQSGRLYRYLDVPPDTFRAMRASYAKGEFFNKSIRARYRFERVTPGDAPAE
ncbi:MAG TPA: KTSC domain-containing protein [Steroidobacteraceae bacterium]|nr:KTSC domain-containing protein [Steroidobacteraceae bacterium]